jgi:hypothetical protein
MVPTDGAAGVTGWTSMITSADDSDMQLYELVTVKVNVPVGIVVMVVEVPIPVFVVPPGFLITVQLPVDGNPVSTTLPVDNAHVGCVISPIAGAVGVGGCALITTLLEDTEVHPAVLVTVKVYVLGFSPDTVVFVPDPLVIAPSGLRVNVHPAEGNPLKTTLPVAVPHVGWVMVPTEGLDGMAFTVNV